MIPVIQTKEEWQELLKLAENNDSNAQFDVAMYYEDGIVVDDEQIIVIDEVQAFTWIKKAYENGNTEALVRYADYLSAGEFCEKDKYNAIELYKKGISLGNGIAAFNLGVEYRDRYDYESAFKCYEQSLQLGHPAEFTIAKCYYYGIGVEKDKNKAFSILKSDRIKESSQYEMDEANYLIGLLYLKGEVVDKSLQNARYYLELANEDGDHRSAQEILFIIGRSEYD
ncbi:tetratricopeptide repeat protein [Flavobacterium psychrotrophum]|uniref:tetratricopeptide repeat protein n=1 Tax=Flavobacterium psychrotrophum TaxID=2294119 RepID=UPI000E30BF08|nr:tetratricopeptide repeat protein [Flavobacterium psychrotrophum]